MSNLEAPPRTSELWPALVARLSTTRMTTLLGGSGRVVRSTSESDVPWSANQIGGRVLIVPVILAFAVQWRTMQPTPIRFQVQTEFNDARAAGYVVDDFMMEAQREAFDRLQGWTPAATTFGRMMVASPIRLETAWQQAAQRDREETAGLVYLSATYALDVADSPT